MIAIDLDRESHIPLFRQLYTGLRTAILEGRLAPASRLPSTRSLCAAYGVSRNTVLAAFEQLQSEDLVVGRVGAGTIVNPAVAGRLKPSVQRSAARDAEFPAHLAEPVARLAKVPPIPLQEGFGRGYAFTTALPALDQFPLRSWNRLLTRNARALNGLGSDRADSAGHRPLRVALSQYLGASRGVVCTPDQIVVTNGTQQAIDLCARLFLNPGDPAAIEDPGYPGALSAFTTVGAKVHSIPVDSQGISVAALEQCSPAPRAVYTSPSHQFPLGMAMTAQRRLDLLEWAAKTGAWIVEDDYDSEFRYAGPSLTALAGMDSAGHVVYMGTFSKTLLPALRLGYLVLPPRLVRPALTLRAAMDFYTPVLFQAVVAEFMREGHFARHLVKSRSIYAARRRALVDAFRNECADRVTLSMDHTGLRMIAWLPRSLRDTDAAARVREAGIEVLPLSPFYRAVAPPAPGLLLGFGAATESSIESGVKTLASVLQLG